MRSVAIFSLIVLLFSVSAPAANKIYFNAATDRSSLRIIRPNGQYAIGLFTHETPPSGLSKLLLLSCSLVVRPWGVAASKLLPPQKISPAYKGGFSGISAAIMVIGRDRGLRLDYPSVQLDIASGLENKFLSGPDHR